MLVVLRLLYRPLIQGARLRGRRLMSPTVRRRPMRARSDRASAGISLITDFLYLGRLIHGFAVPG